MTSRDSIHGAQCGVTRRVTRKVLLIGLLTVAGLGCARDQLITDPVEKAKAINTYRKEGEQLLKWVDNDRQRRKLDHPLVERHMDALMEASEYFLKASELEPSSYLIRQRLAICEQLIGFVYYLEMQQLDERIEAGGRGVDSLREQRARYWDKTQEHLDNSNRHFLYYYNYIHPRQPWTELLNELRENYEVLDQWENAIRTVEQILKEVGPQMTPENRRQFENMLLRYREQYELSLEAEAPAGRGN